MSANKELHYIKIYIHRKRNVFKISTSHGWRSWLEHTKHQTSSNVVLVTKRWASCFPISLNSWKSVRNHWLGTWKRRGLDMFFFYDCWAVVETLLTNLSILVLTNVDLLKYTASFLCRLITNLRYLWHLCLHELLLFIIIFLLFMNYQVAVPTFLLHFRSCLAGDSWSSQWFSYHSSASSWYLWQHQECWFPWAGLWSYDLHHIQRRRNRSCMYIDCP